MDVTKEEICVKIVDWIRKQPSLGIYCNAITIHFKPDSGAEKEFQDLIGAYNYIVTKEAEERNKNVVDGPHKS